MQVMYMYIAVHTGMAAFMKGAQANHEQVPHRRSMLYLALYTLTYPLAAWR